MKAGLLESGRRKSLLVDGLFDPIPRTDQRFRRRAEPAFSYLNESARTEAAHVRLAYREWLARYPASERPDLVRRFRLEDDRAHTAAAFELALHEALLGLGATARVPPQNQPGTRYDFDVIIDGEAAAVEATLVTDEDDEDIRRQNRTDSLLDALDEQKHRLLAVHVWECGVNGDRQPSFRRLREGMLAVLDEASGDQIAQWAGMVAARDYSRLPRWTYDRDGSKVVFSPVPITPGAQPIFLGSSFRGQVVNLNPPTAMGRVTIGEAVLAKIREKAAKRYDVGGRPLILALAVTHWAGSDNFEVFRALLGTERWPLVERDGKIVMGESFRDCDGAWGRHSRHGISSVSAVLVFRRFQVWAPWTTTWRAYVNPWARTPAPRWLLRLPNWAGSADGAFAYSEGVALEPMLSGPSSSTSPPSTPSSPRTDSPPLPAPAPASTGTSPPPASGSTSHAGPSDPPLPQVPPTEPPTSS